VLPPVPVYRGSTAQAQGLYPWLYGGGLTPAGAYLGIDCLTGGASHEDEASTAPGNLPKPHGKPSAASPFRFS
jgi:hypothetical protein